MRTFEESMTAITAVLDQHPYSGIALDRQGDGWTALAVVMLSRDGSIYPERISAKSCEADGALDYLATQLEAMVIP